MKIKDIQLDNRNANKGTARGQKQIVGSIQRNGFGRSGLLDKNGKAIAGNKTTEAAAEVFGVEAEPIIVQSDGKRPVYVQRTDLDLDDPDPNNAARRLAYEDNLTSHFSFQLDPDIVMADIEAGFNFEAIDISLPDLGAMLEGAARELLRGNGQLKDAEPQIDKAAQLKEQWGTALGQVWEMPSQVDGRPHRIVCGDCTDRAIVEAVMRGERAAFCLTDPPYGLGDKKDSGKNDYSQYEDTAENLLKIARVWLPVVRELCNVVVFSPGVTNAWVYPPADWVMCWFYGGGQLRSPWGFNCWQPFLCYGKDPSLATGNGGRPDAVNMNTPANAGDIDHPCPKPRQLWEWFIERLSFKAGDVVCDPFLGSGTTLIAAHNLHRIARGIEIDPGYVAVTLQRYQDATGIEPRLIG